MWTRLCANSSGGPEPDVMVTIRFKCLLGAKADIYLVNCDVRFAPQSGGL